MRQDQQPIVSVIIPVYNGATYVAAAIDSVLGQTYPHIEVIVIDDGSTDDSKKIVSPYAQAGKVRYIYQENRGLAGARNTGIEAATGKFLKFLDCDDILYPEQLQRQVEHLSGRSDIISLTDYMVLYANGKERVHKIRLIEKDRQLARLIMGNFMPVHTILVETKSVKGAGGFDETLTSLEDADLWLRLLLAGVRIEKVDYVGCIYRIVDKSLSANVDNMFLMRCRVSEKLNRTFRPQLDQLEGMTRRTLLSNNNKLIEGCIARNLDVEQYLPESLANAQRLFSGSQQGFKKVLLASIGCKNYMQFKYRFNCLRFNGYRNNLIYGSTKWRNNSAEEVAR